MFNVFSSSDFQSRFSDIASTIRNGFPVFLETEKREDGMVVISLDEDQAFIDSYSAKAAR